MELFRKVFRKKINKLIKVLIYIDFKSLRIEEREFLFNQDQIPFSPYWEGEYLDRVYKKRSIEEELKKNEFVTIEISDKEKINLLSISYKNSNHATLSYILKSENYHEWHSKNAILGQESLKIGFICDYNFHLANNTSSIELLKVYGYKEKYFHIIKYYKERWIDAKKNVARGYNVDDKYHFIGASFCVIVNPDRFQTNITKRLLTFPDYFLKEKIKENHILYLYDNPLQDHFRNFENLRKKWISYLNLI